MAMRRLALICITAAAVAAVAAVAGQAIAGDGGTGELVTVARGKVAHRAWSLAVQGRHHRRCYTLAMNGRSAGSAITACRSDRHRPPLWNRLGGITSGKASVELDITRTRVRSMRVRIGHPRTNQPSEWIHVRPRRVTRSDADKANVRRNFRFAVLHTRGTLCVKQVILFNRKHHRIDRRRVPCEF